MFATTNMFYSPVIEMHQGTSGERKGTYRTGSENLVFDANGRSVIPAEDMAIAIVDELNSQSTSASVI